jgi:DNA polymerase-2
MTNRRIEGWLFDVDELGPEVALWVHTAEGHMVRLTETFHPLVYVAGERNQLRSLACEMDRRGIVSNVRWVERREFWTGSLIEVLELHIADSSLMPRLRRLAASRDRDLTFYNCDIPAAQHYLYVKQLFPLCRLACESNEAGGVVEIAALDSPWETDYKLPDLRTVRMRGEHMRPASQKSSIILECGSERARLRLEDGARAIQDFNAFIERHAPDVILSERGDGLLMPALLGVARREKIDLMIDRDRVVTKRKIETEGRTYFSYGRVIYKGPSYPLFGRWHIDARNSFIHREAELEGLVELARLAKIPVQRMARTTPGSAMSSMQMDRAIRDDVLIPWRKSEPERYKTALELLTVDKGGLVFQPPVGAFERVAEIDFASMYPAIMVRHNISPETVLCSCCENSVVPEAGYNICEKRPGLIPLTLGPLLERRTRYKKLTRECKSKAERDVYESRQAAIKWMLVSCFGYLGYKNARFGRIEAHEAVTAFGREKLLQAKELSEARGFSVLHALTDSLWMKREGSTCEEVRAVCEEITQATGIEMSLEGVYSWIVFLPSKVNSNRSVACRYYGVFDDGRLKLRGLACRRSDTPQFIKDVQWELLEIVAKAKTLGERFNLLDEAAAALRKRMGELERGEVDPQKLLVKRTLTKEIDDYTVDTRTVIAARQLKSAGVKVRPGERVRYVITNARAKDRSKRVKAEEVASGSAYDVEEYIKLLEIAATEVIR